MNQIPPVLIFRLFPELINARWGYLNANEMAKDICTALDVDSTKSNLFLDPYLAERWLNFIHKIKEIQYSWGGWLEDRSVLWSGHYQKPGECVHLGIDVNVPVGTPVYMPINGKLVHSFNDPDQNGGWGGKLIFQYKGGYLVLGHLDEIPNDLDADYEQGKKVGVIAKTERNGGWFPHLHVQTMRKFDPDVDGYSAYYTGIEKAFPNPIEL